MSWNDGYERKKFNARIKKRDCRIQGCRHDGRADHRHCES